MNLIGLLNNSIFITTKMDFWCIFFLACKKTVNVFGEITEVGYRFMEPLKQKLIGVLHKL